MSFQLSKHQLQCHSLMPKYNSFLIFRIFSIIHETIPNGKTLRCTQLLFSLTFILTSLLKSQGGGQRKGLYVRCCILLFKLKCSICGKSIQNSHRRYVRVEKQALFSLPYFLSKRQQKQIFLPQTRNKRIGIFMVQIFRFIQIFSQE